MWTLLQSLDPATFVPEVGHEVTVTAHAADSAPIAGLALFATRAGGFVVALGTTDAQGRIAFCPQEPGPHEVRAKVAGRRPDDPEIDLVTVLDVRPARSRARLLWWTMPLGLLLAWHGLRRLRRA